MPVVTVMQSPRDIGRKRRLVAGITKVFTEVYGVKPEQVSVYIQEVDDANWASAGRLAKDR